VLNFFQPCPSSFGLGMARFEGGYRQQKGGTYSLLLAAFFVLKPYYLCELEKNLFIK